METSSTTSQFPHHEENVPDELKAGAGRVIGFEEEYVGVDLDGCLSPETGQLSTWAGRILDRLDSYSEVSPSLKGIKVWTRAPGLTTSYKKPGLEIYVGRRYF